MSQSEAKMHSTVLDSDAQQVGALYGKAILGAAGTNVDEIVSQLNAIVAECLSPNPGLEKVLASPRVSQVDKESLINKVFQGRVNPTLLNFLKVLCRRGRIGSLRAIQIAANEMRDAQLGRVRVGVVSAFSLTQDQRDQLTQRLGQSLGRSVVLVEQVDEGLLGGIQVRIGDQVIDGSVLGKMSAIRSAIAGGIQKAIRDQYSSLLSS